MPGKFRRKGDTAEPQPGEVPGYPKVDPAPEPAEGAQVLNEEMTEGDYT